MDGEMSGGPAGGFVPPDLKMTQPVRTVPADSQVGTDEAAQLTMPDRPLGAVRPTVGTQLIDVRATPPDQPVALPAVVDDPMAATMTVAAGPSAQPGFGPADASQRRERRKSLAGLPGRWHSDSGRIDIPGNTGKSGKPGKNVLAAAMVAMGVVVIGAGVAALWPSDGASQQSAESSPGSSPARNQRGGAAPAGNPTVSRPASPGLSNGRLVSYRTTRREQGYFEGMLTVTNRTGAPLSAWQMSFSYPGVNVKNIWGGVLVRGGASPVIRGESAAGPVPVGGTVQVRFGAAGIPSAPQGCTLNGRPC